MVSPQDSVWFRLGTRKKDDFSLAAIRGGLGLSMDVTPIW
jgi:hypothetical protein